MHKDVRYQRLLVYLQYVDTFTRNIFILYMRSNTTKKCVGPYLMI